MHSGILASAVLSISILTGGVAFAGQVIDHAMGTTEVPDAPLRVITLTNETTEAALALGVTPVGAPQSWYGDPWYPHLGDRLDGTEVLGTGFPTETQPEHFRVSLASSNVRGC